MKFTTSSSLLSLLPTLLLLVDPSSALVLSKRANTPLLSSIASANTRPQDSSKSAPKYTIEVPRVSQAWCGHTPPAENFTPRPMALPTDAVKHPGSLLFTDAMIRNTLEKAAAVAVNGQALQFGFNKYPRTFKNENRAEWLPRGPMIAGAPGELYEFPIMPSGDPPTVTAGVQAPAGKQGPFRVIYSVSGENPKVFRFYGVVGSRALFSLPPARSLAATLPRRMMPINTLPDRASSTLAQRHHPLPKQQAGRALKRKPQPDVQQATERWRKEKRPANRQPEGRNI
ncbi:uncharacterized protein LAJ45_06392 [Morchella importuna]|uniref:uncharacterized protein n=1 Tax=Morchella importuna TaxID=1174673 RepID=UPI001E8D3F73|nr:uncharacterized protein LAJ45_06392 [Morchella importuna]KAH8149761.1 hypothetical protein LAJ45_06392 [Morchella importuna]